MHKARQGLFWGEGRQPGILIENSRWPCCTCLSFCLCLSVCLSVCLCVYVCIPKYICIWCTKKYTWLFVCMKMYFCVCTSKSFLRSSQFPITAQPRLGINTQPPTPNTFFSATAWILFFLFPTKTTLSSNHYKYSNWMPIFFVTQKCPVSVQYEWKKSLELYQTLHDVLLPLVLLWFTEAYVHANRVH